jgi:Thioredoxin-like/Peptide methionine sulfoxide reductase
LAATFQASKKGQFAVKIGPMSRICFSLILLFGFMAQAAAQQVELGKINWIRDFEQGLARSKKEQKPVFLLFQEVPGCSTCQRYGQQVLSHPLIVEAVESLFIPVAIHNNKGGKDAEVLKFYNEPTWNNPVVRIVDEQRKNVIDRISGNYTPQVVVQNMVAALNKSGKAVPRYLELLNEEMTAELLGTKTAYLSMYCFWTGEKELGKLPGVVKTEAGFMNGHEVVALEYNPRLLSYDDLLKAGSQVKCADAVYTDEATEQAKADKVLGKGRSKGTSTYRRDPETKYYLYQSAYRAVPMTDLQAARVNSLLAKGQSPDEVLSPRQIALAKQAKNDPKANKNLIGKDIATVWPWTVLP